MKLSFTNQKYYFNIFSSLLIKMLRYGQMWVLYEGLAHHATPKNKNKKYCGTV